LPILLLLFISRFADCAVCCHWSLSALSVVPPSPVGRSTLVGWWGGCSASKWRIGAPSASSHQVGGTLWPLKHTVTLNSPSHWLSSVGYPRDQLSRVASSAFLQRCPSTPPELAVGVHQVSWTPSLYPSPFLSRSIL